MRKSIRVSCLGLTSACLLTSANAAITSTDVINEDPTFFDSDISPSLITNGQSSLSLVTVSRTPDNGFASGGVNDGSAIGASLATTDQNTLTFFNDLETTAIITFKLNQGYDITSISSLAGWGDSYFGSQLFTISLEIGDSGVYDLLGNYGETPYRPPAPAGFPEVDDNGYSILTTVFNDAPGALLATNVTGIRFEYSDPYPSDTRLNGVVIRELSVFGSPIPEPSSLFMSTLCFFGLFFRRCRS